MDDRRMMSLRNANGRITDPIAAFAAGVKGLCVGGPWAGLVVTGHVTTLCCAKHASTVNIQQQVQNPPPEKHHHYEWFSMSFGAETMGYWLFDDLAETHKDEEPALVLISELNSTYEAAALRASGRMS